MKTIAVFILAFNYIQSASIVYIDKNQIKDCLSVSYNFPFCLTHCCDKIIAPSEYDTDDDYKKHKLAIVVPFRDRFDELLYFVPSISKYLSKKAIDFKIYIINQADNYRFNRASLINVGFLFSQKECDYMAMHDVDLIPLNTDLDYGYPRDGPYHVSAPDLHPKYHYKEFIGGILIVNKKNYIKVNGMSNRFFGWGREDDEFYMRLKEADMNIYRPVTLKFKSDSTNTFKHNHCPIKRQRDYYQSRKQKTDSFKRDPLTGLDTIQYRIQNHETLNVGNYSCVIVNVELYCNKQLTPWCESEYQFL
jgi:xylosylprotein 4-beta-galactosyltransferase